MRPSYPRFPPESRMARYQAREAKLLMTFEPAFLIPSCSQEGSALMMLYVVTEAGRIICPPLPDMICLTTASETVSGWSVASRKRALLSVIRLIRGVRTQLGWTILDV